MLVFPIGLHQHHTTPLVSVPPQLGKVIILPLLQLIIVLWGLRRNSHSGKLSLHLNQLLFFCCHGQRVTIDSLDDLHAAERIGAVFFMAGWGYGTARVLADRPDVTVVKHPLELLVSIAETYRRC